jgi:hypothetical protein
MRLPELCQMKASQFVSQFRNPPTKWPKGKREQTTKNQKKVERYDRTDNECNGGENGAVSPSHRCRANGENGCPNKRSRMKARERCPRLQKNRLRSRSLIVSGCFHFTEREADRLADSQDRLRNRSPNASIIKPALKRHWWKPVRSLANCVIAGSSSFAGFAGIHPLLLTRVFISTVELRIPTKADRVEHPIGSCKLI